MQDSDSMDTFWLWLEQQEEQNMCDCTSNVKRTPHKHAACIKAWADGCAIQKQNSSGVGWHDDVSPAFNPNWVYRIKPEPATDLERYGVEVGDVWSVDGCARTVSSIRCDKIFTGGAAVTLLSLDAKLGRSAYNLHTLLFRRGVINRLSEV